MNNHQSQILNYLPNTIILNIDMDGFIIHCYGDNIDKNTVAQKHIKEIFDNDTLQKFLQLTSFKKSTVIITYKNKLYEVSFRNLLSEKFFYFYDVTKYNTIEHKLQESLSELKSKKEELHAVFDLAANGISILDKNGTFIYANKFFQKMIGYSMDELRKHSCISLSSPEYEKASKIAVQKTIRYGSIENFKKVCITKNGTYLNASMSLSYLDSSDEIMMITSNITEDILYQDKLKQQIEDEVSKRAQQYEIMCHQSRLASMGEMIDSIAHQWRQPLNSLAIITQGLKHLTNQENFDFELLTEIESEIMEKVTYMSQTIDDFTKFFRISKQKENFNVIQSINEAIRLIDVQLQSHNIHTNIYREKDCNTNVFGYVNEFRQVILNIIHNAMMAIISVNQTNGKIEISIQSQNNNLHIKILDNGAGIKEENLSKIFDPYFTTKDKGNGIGLYMSKIIIEHHMDGLLRVKNTHEGVEFTIMLEKRKN